MKTMRFSCAAAARSSSVRQLPRRTRSAQRGAPSRRACVREAPTRRSQPKNWCVSVSASQPASSRAPSISASGRSVAVLEAREVGNGVTSGSTGHLTQILDTRYHEIERKLGAERARLVARSNGEAIEQIVGVASLAADVAGGALVRDWFADVRHGCTWICGGCGPTRRPILVSC